MIGIADYDFCVGLLRIVMDTCGSPYERRRVGMGFTANVARKDVMDYIH